MAQFGWIPQFPDRRDIAFTASPDTEILDEVDLRPGQSEILNQGDIGSCTGQAVARALRYVRHQQGQDEFESSRLMLYYGGREALGTILVDSGAMLRDVIKFAAKTGACPEAMWPYNADKFRLKPPPEAYDAAQKYRALSYRAIPKGAGFIKRLHAALCEDCPVVFGVMVYNSFMSRKAATTGVVPMPGRFERPIGGHAITAVGYTKKHFIFANSWGADWGDGGYGYLSHSYLRNLGSDFWAIRMVTPQ